MRNICFVPDKYSAAAVSIICFVPSWQSAAISHQQSAIFVLSLISIQQSAAAVSFIWFVPPEHSIRASISFRLAPKLLRSQFQFENQSRSDGRRKGRNTSLQVRSKGRNTSLQVSRIHKLTSKLSLVMLESIHCLDPRISI